MLVVWKFYCGLVKFASCEQKFKKIITKNSEHSLFHFQCAYESQQQVACDLLVKSTNENIHITDICLTTQDFTALGFVLTKRFLYCQRKLF